MNPDAVPFQPSDSSTTTVSKLSTSTSLWTSGNQAILLQTARAIVYNPIAPEKSRRVRIVFDSGSQRSYLREQVAEGLALTSEDEKSLTIMTFGSKREQTRVCNLVRLGLITKDETSKQLTLFTIPTICEPIAGQPISICCNDFDHLAGMDLADYSDGDESLEVDILIGSDQYWELVTGETRRGNSGPVAICTKLGRLLSASTTSYVPTSCLFTHSLRVDLQQLDNRIKSFWELESFGISASEHSVYDDFGSSIRLVDGRYEVQLPWREGHPALADNYQQQTTINFA